MNLGCESISKCTTPPPPSPGKKRKTKKQSLGSSLNRFQPHPKNHTHVPCLSFDLKWPCAVEGTGPWSYGDLSPLPRGAPRTGQFALKGQPYWRVKANNSESKSPRSMLIYIYICIYIQVLGMHQDSRDPLRCVLVEVRLWGEQKGPLTQDHLLMSDQEGMWLSA